MAVIGGGPAGLVSALALAAAGVDTLLIAPPAKPDHRTTALLAGSVTALETLGVWQACLPHAAALRKIRLVDDTARLIRAPEMSFDAAEIGLDAFGFNIENRHLLAALDAHATSLKLPRIASARIGDPHRCDGRYCRSCRLARYGRGLQSAPTAIVRCAVRRPASPPRAAPIRKRRSRSI